MSFVRRNWLPIAVVVLLVIVGVNLNRDRGDDGPGDGGGGGNGGGGGSGCESVPRSTLGAIEDGLTVSGGGTLRTGYAVQVGEWWYVGAEIDGPGIEDAGDIGIWAVPDPADPGPIIMADGYAEQFSEWGTRVGAENSGVWGQGSAVRGCFD